MDDARFDRMTKWLAGRGSRRSLLGVGAAVATAFVARTRFATAAPYSVPLGGVCYHDRQCFNDYVAPRGGGLNPDFQEVYCAPNGFEYDGDFNCCRFDGGYCEWSEECCGDLDCIGNFCTSPPPVMCSAYLCTCDPYYNRCEPGLGCCPSEIGFVCAPWCYGG